jgi:succinyl-diaminopimelate desuccinylase
MDIDVRYLPGQEPADILAQVGAMEDVDILRTFNRVPAIVSRANPFVGVLSAAVSRSVGGEVMSVGRDGASDAVSFLEAGIPAVEFGPHGGGHHGPDEWVSIDSLERYRLALGDFIRELPLAMAAEREPAAPRETSTLESIEGVKR